MAETPASAPPGRFQPFGADAPDAFEPGLPARHGARLDLLRRLFRHEVRGLERIPARGPVLLVLNHGPLPVDALCLARAILDGQGRWPRFLGERLIFEHPALAARLAPWGVVEGNHYQARRRFLNGDLVAVFPGGAREAWKPYRERRHVRWADRDGFARLAFKSGVPIVPVACPRAEDLYVVLNDGLALGERIWGERRRLPLPLAFGLGPLPFPVKLVHHVGEPIRTEPRRSESADAAVARIHGEAVAAMEALLAQ